MATGRQSGFALFAFFSFPQPGYQHKGNPCCRSHQGYDDAADPNQRIDAGGLRFAFRPGEAAVFTGVQDGGVLLLFSCIPDVGLLFRFLTAGAVLPVAFCICQPGSFGCMNMFCGFQHRRQLKIAG